MEFVSGLKRVWVEIKIYLVLRFIYPSKPQFKKIKIILSKDVQVDDDVVIEEGVEIGNLKKLSTGIYLGRRTYIGACSSIGKFTSISFDVKIGLIAHPLNYISTSPVFYAKRRGWVEESSYNETSQGLVEIGNDVLISANVTVLAGVKIGNGAVIGAGAFVNKDVPPYAIVVGSPAKVVKYRFSRELINQLQESKWWDLPKEDLLKHKMFFNNPEEFVSHLKSESC
jgi:acetyltransferase-like isoleucine patch superfamily enzyme